MIKLSAKQPSTLHCREEEKMGTWGTGFWSDDKTSEIRDDYLRLVRKKTSPEDAVRQLTTEYKPDEDDETGYLFWLAIAALQWKYGHLSAGVKEKAMRALNSNLDEQRWADASRSEQKKRKEIMRSLKLKLCSENPKPQKLKPYGVKKNPWTVGDVLSIQFNQTDQMGRAAYHAYEGLYGAVLIVDFWELDLGDLYFNPVLALYDWVGAVPATSDDLRGKPFIKTNMYSKRTAEKHFFAADMPWKRLLAMYSIERIGHLSELPFSQEAMREGYRKYSYSWGTIGGAIIEHQLKTQEAEGHVLITP